MKILLLGATGYLGGQVVANLGFADRVRCLVRKTSNVSSLTAPNIELFYGDLTDKDSLDPAMEGIDIVVHTVKASTMDKEEQYKVNVTGTQNVLDLCLRHNIKKLIYISAVGVIYKEEHHNDYIKSKIQAEDRVIKAGLNSIILRSPLIYNQNSLLVKIVKLFSRFPVLILPETMFDYRFQQPVYIDDMVQTLVKAILTDDFKKNHPYFVTGPSSPRLSELIDWCTIYPFRPLKIRMPLACLKLFQGILRNPSIQNFLSSQKEFYQFDLKECREDFDYRPREICEVITGTAKIT
ncbi:MAG: hypothetical protein COV67_11040 [Nitrospinae bacterium CG11_big_fil_rev_8_21_14_0_20_56_8]|nr:MAG: hypothetical protein COV67_11040 [Nitrospinae bacterium CG11_big_fil_rev_8_21_14_0_20_56_8]